MKPIHGHAMREDTLGSVRQVAGEPVLIPEGSTVRSAIDLVVVGLMAQLQQAMVDASSVGPGGFEVIASRLLEPVAEGVEAAMRARLAPHIVEGLVLRVVRAPCQLEHGSFQVAVGYQLEELA